MGSKQDPHRSYGQKIITLFVKLLFTREEYSLSEPAGKIHRRVRRGRGGGISTPRREDAKRFFFVNGMARGRNVR